MAESHAGYLHDLGVLLRDRAVEARDRALPVSSDSSPDNSFEVGYWHAYWEVLSLMVQQAHAFDLPLTAMGLVGWEPDRELFP